MLKCFSKALLLTMTLSTISYAMEDHHIFDVSPQAKGRKYTLVYDDDNHNYSRNWITRNHGNFKVKNYSAKADVLPKTVDFRTQCPPVFDQGQLGSCTANAISGAVGLLLKKQNQYTTPMSRLFIYYNERKIEGTINEDSGASLTDGIKTMMDNGVCHETLWPYSDDTSTFKKKPSDAAYKEALNYLDVDDAKLAAVNQDAITIKTILAKGNPIVLGFDVYSSFESNTVARTGIVPMPNTKKEQYLGGHAVMLVGYDDNDKTFLVRNSWGTSWGMAGYCKMPQSYLLDTNMAGDFWSLSKIGTKTQPTPTPTPTPQPTPVTASDVNKVLVHLTSTISEMQKVQTELSALAQAMNSAKKATHV